MILIRLLYDLMIMLTTFKKVLGYLLKKIKADVTI